MENIKLYLENSTIHGLSYIPSNRKLIRLFWITVVISGFTGAGVLINQSFNDWSNNPVTTTIETLPIADAAYPIIIVCPPKNTYLDLNYHFLKNKNITKAVSYDIQYKILESFSQHFQQKDFELLHDEIKKFKEINKYWNWYLGLTKVPSILSNYEYDMTVVETFAPSGEISSPYFREEFNLDKFLLNKVYSMNLQNPYAEAANITFEIDHDVVENFECIELNHYCLESKKDKLRGTITIGPIQGLDLIFHRNFQKLSFTDWKKKRFTGLSVKWDYVPNSDNSSILKNYNSWNKYNKIFTIITNLVHRLPALSKEEFMHIARSIKSDWMNIDYILNPQLSFRYHSMDDLYDKRIWPRLGNKLNESFYSVPSEPMYYKYEVADETLETAAEMMLYLLSPQDKYWTDWYQTYDTWLRVKEISLRRLLRKCACTISNSC